MANILQCQPAVQLKCIIFCNNFMGIICSCMCRQKRHFLFVFLHTFINIFVKEQNYEISFLQNSKCYAIFCEYTFCSIKTIHACSAVKQYNLLLGRQVESKLIGFYNLLYGHRHLAAPSTHTYMARIPSPACKLISCYNLIYGHRHLAAPSTHTVHIWHIYPVEQANQLL